MFDYKSLQQKGVTDDDINNVLKRKGINVNVSELKNFADKNIVSGKTYETIAEIINKTVNKENDYKKSFFGGIESGLGKATKALKRPSDIPFLDYPAGFARFATAMPKKMISQARASKYFLEDQFDKNIDSTDDISRKYLKAKIQEGSDKDIAIAGGQAIRTLGDRYVKTPGGSGAVEAFGQSIEKQSGLGETAASTALGYGVGKVAGAAFKKVGGMVKNKFGKSTPDIKSVDLPDYIPESYKNSFSRSKKVLEDAISSNDVAKIKSARSAVEVIQGKIDDYSSKKFKTLANVYIPELSDSIAKKQKIVDSISILDDLDVLKDAKNPGQLKTRIKNALGIFTDLKKNIYKTSNKSIPYNSLFDGLDKTTKKESKAKITKMIGKHLKKVGKEDYITPEKVELAYSTIQKELLNENITPDNATFFGDIKDLLSKNLSKETEINTSEIVPFLDDAFNSGSITKKTADSILQNPKTNIVDLRRQFSPFVKVSNSFKDVQNIVKPDMSNAKNAATVFAAIAGVGVVGLGVGDNLNMSNLLMLSIFSGLASGGTIVKPRFLTDIVSSISLKMNTGNAIRDKTADTIGKLIPDELIKKISGSLSNNARRQAARFIVDKLAEEPDSIEKLEKFQSALGNKNALESTKSDDEVYQNYIGVDETSQGQNGISESARRTIQNMRSQAERR